MSATVVTLPLASAPGARAEPGGDRPSMRYCPQLESAVQIGSEQPEPILTHVGRTREPRIAIPPLEISSGQRKPS